jgi:hypothetical protein
MVRREKLPGASVLSASLNSEKSYIDLLGSLGPWGVTEDSSNHRSSGMR